MVSEGNNNRGYVTDIQRYSIHDGPGIRTTVFLKGCPLRCFWCQNPEAQEIKPQIMYYSERCSVCGHCVEACPEGAVKIKEGVLRIDRDKCVACGSCEKICLNLARQITGKLMNAHDVIEEIKKDEKFYDNSGGGMTISGGEPLFQSQFTFNILKSCKEEGFHTALETCGIASWDAYKEVIDFVDLFLFDIKHMDSDKHISGTGMPNRLILENVRKIAAQKPMLIRTPLIPGFNNSKEAIRDIAHFVKKELPSVKLELLAYNKMGESKYARLDMLPIRLKLQNEEEVRILRDIAEREFI